MGFNPNSLFITRNSSLEGAPLFFFFVADQSIADLDFDRSFKDHAALVALTDFIGVFLVLLEVHHFSGTDDFLAPLDFEERTTEHLPFAHAPADNHIALTGFKYGQYRKPAIISSDDFRGQECGEPNF